MKEPLAVMLLLIASMFAVAFACRMWSVKFGSVVTIVLNVVNYQLWS